MRRDLASLVGDWERRGGETAVVAHRGVRRYATSYAEMAELAGRFSAELSGRGIGAGERVVIWGANSAEWIGVFFGCVLRGVVAVPLDAAGTREFAERVIADVGARLVVGDRELVEGLGGALVLGDLRDWAAREALRRVDASVGEDAVLQIVFTSGTTSEPKGIVHTHRNVLAGVRPIEREVGKYLNYERWVHPLRFLETLPLSHVFGQFMGLWLPGVLGAEVHFEERLEAGRLVDLGKRERISVLVAVPRVLGLVKRHLEREFGGLREGIDGAKGLRVWWRWWRFRRVHGALGWKFWAVISGGAAVGEELERFWNGLGIALIQGYGMTETAALVTLNHPFKVGQGTIGRPLPGREVRIGENGELMVRGEMLAGATWQNGAMRARESEWLSTGDLAEENAAGELRFVGRVGDAIVTGAGMNVHPADVEEAFARAGVEKCLVVGCAGVGGMEAVGVVAFRGSEAELNAAVETANAGLAEFQRVRRVLRWTEAEFPFTSTGKVLRRTVRDWACGRLGGGGVVEGGDLLGELVRESGGVGEDGALALDSLGRVELGAAIERRLGVEVGDEALAGVRTMGELRGLVGLAEASGAGEDGMGSGAEVGSAGREDLRAERGAAVRAEKDVYPRWPWNWAVRWVRVGFIEGVMRPLVWVLGKPTVVRAGGAVPEGAMLVIANHRTAYDGALVLYGLPGQVRRRVAVAMSAEMLRDLRAGRGQGTWIANLLAPVGYWLITGLFNVFPLPRRVGFRRSFDHAGEAMDRGMAVMIFPEGTRSKTGRMGAFRQGIGLLATEAGVPVLPVGLRGLGERRWFRSGTLEVRVGEVVVWDREDAAELTRKLEAEVRELAGEE